MNFLVHWQLLKYDDDDDLHFFVCFGQIRIVRLLGQTLRMNFNLFCLFGMEQIEHGFWIKDLNVK